MKKGIIFLIVCIIVLGIFFIPKYLSEGDAKVKFKSIENNEIPQKIIDILPNYLAEERALGCRIEDEVFVVVTRGEKKTEGYSVTIDKIEKAKNENDQLHVTVYAVFKDPKPDEIVAQRITYPFAIVKTNLNELPATIELEVEYEE